MSLFSEQQSLCRHTRLELGAKRVLDITVTAEGSGRWRLENETTGELRCFSSEAAVFEALEDLCREESRVCSLLIRTPDGEWQETEIAPPSHH